MTTFTGPVSGAISLFSKKPYPKIAEKSLNCFLAKPLFLCRLLDCCKGGALKLDVFPITVAGIWPSPYNRNSLMKFSVWLTAVPSLFLWRSRTMQVISNVHAWQSVGRYASVYCAAHRLPLIVNALPHHKMSVKLTLCSMTVFLKMHSVIWFQSRRYWSFLGYFSNIWFS